MLDIQDILASDQSARFNASDADIIFKSADNVLFNIHRKNLEATTGAFPAFEALKPGQSVLLSETSTTLDLMFQYIYPMPQPDVPSLAFEALVLLTEAVEKYRVFPAMLICKIHMRKFLSDHVQEIVGYAAKYGYNDIIAEAAPLLLVIPLEEALSQLPADLVVPWAQYHSAWDRVLCLARSFATKSEIAELRNEHHTSRKPELPSPVQSWEYSDPIPCPTNPSEPTGKPYKKRKPHNKSCSANVDRAVCDVLVELGNVGCLRNLDYVFTSISSCEDVTDCMVTWRKMIEREVNTIKPFIAYL